MEQNRQTIVLYWTDVSIFMEASLMHIFKNAHYYPFEVR